MHASHSFQQAILDRVIFRFPKKAHAIKAISNILDISLDAVYRRLRGDSYLAPQEIFKLVDHFNISLDPLIKNQENSIVFEFHRYDTKLASIEDFLKNISALLKGAHLLTNPKIYIASSDIPIFYYALSPSLFKFKLYVWGNTIWDFNLFKEKPFSLDLFPHYIDNHIAQIRKAYFDIETIELWSLSLVEDTLNQMSYFMYCDRFANQEVLWMLFDDLLNLTYQLKKVAKSGFKSNPESTHSRGPITIYHNEVIHSVNTIMLRSKEQNLVFTPFSSPNYLLNKDEATCQDMQEWYEKIMDKSNLISVYNEKNRSWFFHQLIRKIEFAKEQLKSLSY